MKIVAIASFLAGLLLWVRVMFFGVRRVDEDRFYHRKWPLAAAAFFMVAGVLLYAAARNGPVTAGWIATVVLMAFVAAGGAAWLVQRSAAIPSTDPEDDPKFMFQGHVAQITEAIDGTDRGRVAFVFDDKKHEFRARWSPAAELPEDRSAMGAVGAEVVIETVEGDLAYVEPWVLVEERL
ncbi:MAG TPA: hypothetical protein VFO66_14980 [Gemmatimonadaceae bacterium]|nr:hypothetical protein [Gemmatimonadaceae bacterium]